MPSLADYQRDFIRFMLDCKVLRFGQFVTKSGRQTPYFINTGHYDDGRRLRRLGQFYARTIIERFGRDFDLLYGPAYKGIPLVVATAAALDELYGLAVPYSFNRKEAKDHGETGALIGHPVADGQRIVIVDDVVTAGTSVNESVTLLRGVAAVEIVALIVSVDRQERGQSSATSALAEVANTHCLFASSIVNLDDILAYLQETAEAGAPVVDAAHLQRIADYRAAYGASR